MAEKPVIKKITPFDASNGTTVTFTYTGEQPYRNRITIYNADTLVQVFQEEVSTMNLEHTIPAGSTTNNLTNGTQYCCEIVCYDIDGNASTTSDKVYFWVLSAPDFYFDGLLTGNDSTTGDPLVNYFETSSPTVELVYYQDQWDSLEEHIFYLYDENKQLLKQTDTIYSYEEFEKHMYEGLKNETKYYARATGLTGKGISVDTGYICIFVNFNKPEMYAVIYVESDDKGIVDGYTNYKIINPTRTDYTISDGFLQLQNDVIIYQSEFQINGDFVFAVQFRNLSDTTFLTLRNDDYRTITATQFTDDSGLVRYRLDVCNNLLTSDPDRFKDVLYTEGQPFGSETVTLWIVRINNIYGIYAISENRKG